MATQYKVDIGTKPNQVPTNSMLGGLAFQSQDAIHPVGAVYACVNAKALPFGVWEQIGEQTIGAETVTYFKRTA